VKGLVYAGMICAAGFAGPGWAAPAGDAKALGGVYDDIKYIEEAGDVVGIAVDFRPGGASPTIVVTICEGECRGGKAWPVKIDGRRIAFTVIEDLIDQDGKQSQEANHYHGLFRADGALVITLDGTSDVHDVLRRVRRPAPHQVEQAGCGKDRC